MWIFVTLGAVVFQATRTSLQQKLRAQLSITAAGFVRYFYGAPIALGAVAVAVVAFGQSLDAPRAVFWVTVTAAGVAQIVATVALIAAFDRRGFAVGTVYSKTEVLQVALFSAVVLHEPLRVWGWLGAVVCVVGVGWLALTSRPDSAADARGILRLDAALALGLLAGAGFALASVWIRASSKSLGDHPAVFRALVTLAAMNTIQVVINGAQMLVTKPDDVLAVARTWRSSAVVGVLSVCGSAGWAIAVTLENAAKVRALGQVELLLTFAISHRFLGERHRRSEFAASAVTVAGVAVVLVLG
jgi:drug/metabolite transporter (DMT)-like permease